MVRFAYKLVRNDGFCATNGYVGRVCIGESGQLPKSHKQRVLESRPARRYLQTARRCKHKGRHTEVEYILQTNAHGKQEPRVPTPKRGQTRLRVCRSGACRPLSSDAHDKGARQGPAHTGPCTPGWPQAQPGGHRRPCAGAARGPRSPNPPAFVVPASGRPSHGGRAHGPGQGGGARNGGQGRSGERGAQSPLWARRAGSCAGARAARPLPSRRRPCGACPPLRRRPPRRAFPRSQRRAGTQRAAGKARSAGAGLRSGLRP